MNFLNFRQRENSPTLCVVPRASPFFPSFLGLFSCCSGLVRPPTPPPPHGFSNRYSVIFGFSRILLFCFFYYVCRISRSLCQLAFCTTLFDGFFNSLSFFRKGGRGWSKNFSSLRFDPLPSLLSSSKARCLLTPNPHHLIVLNLTLTSPRISGEPIFSCLFWHIFFPRFNPVPFPPILLRKDEHPLLDLTSHK